jgi:hypothetical protein
MFKQEVNETGYPNRFTWKSIENSKREEEENIEFPKFRLDFQINDIFSKESKFLVS